MGLLACICPEVIQQILLTFGDDLSADRAQRVIDITLHAADLLPQFSKLDQIHVAPGLLLRIVEEGSQSGADNLIRFWSGLLASSCLTTDGLDTSMIFIDTFSQLSPEQARIFIAGCDAAVKKKPAGTGDAALVQVFCTQEEIRQFAETRNLGHIERDLQHLHSLGLLEQTTNTRLFGEIERANITPTPFGMQLYFRCSG